MSGLKYDIKTHLDDPATTLSHREIIKSKPFLKKIYLEWYNVLKEETKQYNASEILEIGSGGGFLDEVIPGIITSDILPLPHCKMTFSAEKMPLPDKSLSAIVMLNVFHHIPKPHLFLKEAERVLKPGGKIVMIEPGNTLFSRFIYKNFHHELFDEKGEWEIESTGPMSCSNQALPYIYFERDYKKFKSEFSSLDVKNITYHSPIRYIISGGVSRKAMVPLWSYGFWRFSETLLSPLARVIGLFETITITHN